MVISPEKSQETVFILWSCLRVFFIRSHLPQKRHEISDSHLSFAPLSLCLQWLQERVTRAPDPFVISTATLLLYLQPRFPVCSCMIKGKWLKWCSLSLCQKPGRNAIAYTPRNVLSLLVESMCSYCRGTLWSLNWTLEVWMHLWQKAGFSWCL